MSQHPELEKKLTLAELAELRSKSEIISQFLHKQLKAILETLEPLLAPERLLGKYAGGLKDIGGASKALSQLKEHYQKVFGQPFNLLREFNADWLSPINNHVELYPWEYIHGAQGNDGTKEITMTSPICWVINYRSGYSLSQLSQAIAGRGDRRPEYVRQFVVNALVMELAFSHNAGLAQIFEGLRYQVKKSLIPGLGKLNLMTITSSLDSFRPEDDLILAATGFSGIPAFIELIDMEAFKNLQDPLKLNIEGLINKPL